MKSFKLMLLLIICLNNSFAKTDKRERNYLEALEMYERGNYFSALDHIGKQYKFASPDQNAKHLIEKILKHTGTHYFNTYGDLELRKMNIPETDLIMAKRNFYLGKNYYGLKRLSKIPRAHRLYPEAMLIRGSIHNKSGDYSKAEDAWRKCSIEAKNKIGLAEEKVNRYFTIIKEDCFINIARMKFKQKDYRGALKHYDSIPKNSFQWPYILLEKAWSHYYLGNYNNTIGTLITYNSPLLASYFTPEAEVLKALSYYKLCLYDDALEVIEKYYKNYTPKSNKLRSVITKNNSSLYFFELMFSVISEKEKESAFLRNLITQVDKRVKFNLDLNTLYALNAEIYANDKKSNQKKLKEIKSDLQEQMNHYVKVSMYRFINQIHSLATEMFNLKLEILSDKRNLVYRNKVSKKLKRGSFKNVTREAHQEFWTFKNEFWADELGDYSLGLKSQCLERS